MARTRRTNRRDIDRRTSRQNRPNIFGAAQSALSRSSLLCKCQMVIAGSVECQSLDHVEVWTVELGDDFGSVQLEYDDDCTWISDTLEFDCEDGTDDYELTLTVSGTGIGDVTLELSRESGENCEEFSATWSNVHPWLPLAANELRLMPGYSMPVGASLPCMVCLRPPTGLVDLPCMEDLYHWSDGVIATQAQREDTFGVPDYVRLGDAEKEHRVYADTTVPEFIAVSGLQWSGATGVLYADEFESWANSLGPIMMRQFNTQTWIGEKTNDIGGVTLAVSAKFRPCDNTSSTSDNPYSTASCETVPVSYLRAGELTIGNHRGDTWVFMVVFPGDPSIRLVEQQTATMIRCGRNDSGYFDASGLQSAAFFDAISQSVELIPQV